VRLRSENTPFPVETLFLLLDYLSNVVCCCSSSPPHHSHHASITLCPACVAAVIKRWIAVMERCVLMGNFASAMAILAAVDHPAVCRLKGTFRLIPDRWRRAFDRVQQLLDVRDNHMGYRQEVHRRLSERLPTIPILALTMRDLTLIEEANPSKVCCVGEDILICMGRRRRRRCVCVCNVCGEFFCFFFVLVRKTEKSKQVHAHHHTCSRIHTCPCQCRSATRTTFQSW
jgi:RasGEF domain